MPAEAFGSQAELTAEHDRITKAYADRAAAAQRVLEPDRGDHRRGDTALMP